jgi:hypothetical protein
MAVSMKMMVFGLLHCVVSWELTDVAEVSC